MSSAAVRRLVWAILLGAGLLAPNPVLELVGSSVAEASSGGLHARRGRAPANRAPRRSVRHDHRHDHYDDVRRARRGRAIARAVVVGTRVRTLPRSCTTVITRNVSYRVCDDVYYRPYYEGTTVVYVVVEAP